MTPSGILGLSKGVSGKLAHINSRKAVYKSIFDAAANKYEPEKSASESCSDSGESALERYLKCRIRPTEFVFAWELSILPFLVEVIPEFLGRGYAINVMRDPRTNSARTICLTTRVKPTRARRVIIARHVLDLIPDRFYKSTSFQFCHGKVEFIQRGTDKKHPDDVCNARNPQFYLLPTMGDSIGPSNEECAATLGPCLKFDDQCFWLANLHVFLKQSTSQQENLVLHPGLLDKDACGHSLVKSNKEFGVLYAYSGNDLTTTRPSSHPFWGMFPESTPHDTVTDWVLIEDFGHAKVDGVKQEVPLLNTLRVPGARRGDPHVTVTKFGLVLPEAKVHTTGRSSGHQYGQICDIPAYIDADADRHTTKPTREWYVEQPKWIADSEESWLEGGIGVPGDSGAPVIDSHNNSLYGQIWGRNKYWGSGPRIAYFTAMSDISIDIQEKCPQLKSPLELPQFSSQDRTILTELYCPECVYPEDNATQPSIGDVSEEMSLMSLSSPSESYSLFEECMSTNMDLPDLQRSDFVLSDNDVLISTDSGDASNSFSLMDQDEFEELLDLLPPATDGQHAPEMELDPYQYYSNMGANFADNNANFAVNNETLSISGDDSDSDDNIPTRSFAHRKSLRYSVPREKFSGSWVMVHARSRRSPVKVH